ncbi:MAG: hypothetical protein JST82_14030 [Bacteroidetes bacterium]|nr:hypothetical protein [Bacteroidota bacterium]
MKDEIFFQYDYFTILQMFDESEIIDLLNQDIELILLVQPSISLLVEDIYHAITDISFTETKAMLLNEEIVNNIVKYHLSNTKYFSILDEKIATSLFSIAFNAIRDKIFSETIPNNEKYVAQSHIQYWIENQMILLIVDDIRFSSPKILSDLIEKVNLSHRFYNRLIDSIPSKWIDNSPEEWIAAPKNPENVLESVRTYDRGSLENYKDLEAQNLSSWRYIEESGRYSDYVMLNEYYSLKSTVLLKHNIHLWVKLWDNFKIPLIQDAAFSASSFSPTQFSEIAKQLVLQQSSLKTPIQYLILLLVKNIFESSVKTSERLSFYSNEEQIKYYSNQQNSEAMIAQGKLSLKSWEALKGESYIKVLTALKHIIPKAEIDEFIFSYTHRGQPQNLYTLIYNSEIDLLTDAYKNVYFQKGYSIALEDIQVNFNLEKFNFYISIIQKSGKADQIIVHGLLTQFTEFTNSKKFYWDRTYSPPYWNVIKGVGFLLSKCKSPLSEARGLINKVKVTHEGWKVNDIDYRNINRECFIYCGIALLFEHKDAFKDSSEKQIFFKELLGIVINQSRYSVFRDNENYLLPLHLCYLVACQVYKRMKKYFENEIIMTIDDLYTVLIILSSEKYEISKGSRKKLEYRFNKEYPYELRMLKRNRLQDKIKSYANAIDILKLSITNY